MQSTTFAKVALAISLTLSSQLCLSQKFHIGFSPGEVIAQANTSNGVQISKRYTNDGDLCISWKDYGLTLETWVYFHQGISVQTVLFPLDRQARSQLITVLNRDYAKRGTSKWVVYYENTTLEIDYSYLSSTGAYIFTIFEVPE